MVDKQYTLITCLGTGQYDEDGDCISYKETTYGFKNNKQIKDKILLNAIINSDCWDIKKMVIIGTVTSAWDALIPEELKGSDLWASLYESCTNKKNQDRKGATIDLLQSLQSILIEHYKIDVELIAHTFEIDENTIENLSWIYYSIYSKVLPKTKILIDLTHGFRSMAILLFQAIQLHAKELCNNPVEIIYGELKREGVSPIRDLSSYWKISQINRQLYNFNSNLDGEELADSLEEYWPEGAQWIKHFSYIIKCDYLMQIDKLHNKLSVYLNTFNENDKPSWVIDLKKSLETFYKRLDKKYVYEKYFEFADFLNEKKLTVQAVIALTCALQTRVISDCFKSKSRDELDKLIGDYAIWESIGFRNLQVLIDDDYNLKTSINDLRGLRNKIAHAAGEQWNAMPKIEDLKFDNYKKAVKEVFRRYDATNK